VSFQVDEDLPPLRASAEIVRHEKAGPGGEGASPSASPEFEGDSRVLVRAHPRRRLHVFIDRYLAPKRSRQFHGEAEKMADLLASWSCTSDGEALTALGPDALPPERRRNRVSRGNSAIDPQASLRALGRDKSRTLDSLRGIWKSGGSNDFSHPRHRLRTTNTSGAWIDAKAKLRLVPVTTKLRAAVGGLVPRRRQGAGRPQRAHADHRRPAPRHLREQALPRATYQSEFVAKNRDRFAFDLVEAPDGYCAVLVYQHLTP